MEDESDISANRGERPTKSHRYDAFISYSHKADAALARALESHLEKFAKPWYRLRAANIFRDETSLTATPHLWPTIVANLNESAYLIILASTAAAQSKWVRKEICHWITDGTCDEPEKLQRAQIVPKRVERMLLVLTEGEITWDDAAVDFDWSRTSALPKEVLSGALQGEPLWVDLCWTRTVPKEQLNRSHEAFLHAVARLSAPLRGLDIESLIGEDYRQHRRSMRHALIAIVALVMLTVLAAVSATGFYRQWTLAEKRANDLTVADGYRLIQLGSEQLASWNTAQAAESFAASQRTFEQVGHSPLMAWHRCFAADLASLSKERICHTEYGSRISELHVSDDGALVALVFGYSDVPVAEIEAAPAIEVWDAGSGNKIFETTTLSEIGKQVSYFWNQEGEVNNVPEASIHALLAPCDLVLRKTSDSGDIFERLSLRDGSRTPYSQNQPPTIAQRASELASLPLNIEFRDTTLLFQPRHSPGKVSFSGFFGVDPVTGNDRMYADPFGERPDQLQAESLDGARLLLGTYEGTVALFECDSYGNQLRRGRIGGIRGLTYVGESRTAIAVDENGDVWRIAEDNPAVLRSLVPSVKVNTEFGGLTFSADGSVLAGCSEKDLFAYSIPGRKLLARATLPDGDKRLLAFGLDDTHQQVFALFHTGKMYSLTYDGIERQASPDFATLPGYGENSASSLVVGCFDFAERLAWLASAARDSDQVMLRAFLLDAPGPSVRSKVISLSKVQELQAMAFRGREVLLIAVAEGAPGVETSAMEDATLLVRVPADANGESSVVPMFEWGTERYNDDLASRVPSVERLLRTAAGDKTFVRVSTGLRSGTYPLNAPLQFDEHRFVDAEAITHIKDDGTDLTVAVTHDKHGIALCIEDVARDLFFRTPLPMTGLLQDCAISLDGQKAAVATSDDGMVLIDLSVYDRGRRN